MFLTRIIMTYLGSIIKKIFFLRRLRSRRMKAFWYNEERKNICGLRIRELRREKKLSCKDLEIKAALAGYGFLTQNTITKIELGIRFVPDYEVVVFAELLDTTLDDLMNYTKKQEE